MSGNVVSEQLSMSDNQLSHMNPVMSKAPSSMPLMVSTEPTNSPTVHQFTASSMPLMVDPISSIPVSMESNLNWSQFPMSNSEHDKLSLPNKRKEVTENLSYNSGPQMSVPNKRAAQGVLSPRDPGELQSSAQSKRISQTPSMLKSSKSAAPSKKVVQIESVGNKSQSTAVKNRSVQPELPRKVQTEANDSVRSKLRESLAAALALVSQKQKNPGNSDKPIQNENLAMTQTVEESKLANSMLASLDGTAMESRKEAEETWKFVGNEFQSNPVLPGDDPSITDGFFFKDELLQGNGLSWAMEDLNAHMPEVKEEESTQKPVLMDEDKMSVESPESVAFKIESELFKLFGGVNKKYKEKGRSLLFNLKDRNNPELRERVMSGEISPERLCSMTAEELASKELSEWRMAKAEELAQMKVLPDQDVNVRRLVKKTHKGEYQVDFDYDVAPVEEVSVAPSLFTDTKPPRKVKGERKNAEGQDGQSRITIPSDSDDMQGLMVDDMKDLPPIVSLDEFMDSLDKEPPFENMTIGSGTRSHVPEKESLEGGFDSKSPVQALKDTNETTRGRQKIEESTKADTETKPTHSHRESETKSAVGLSKGEGVWEGLLHLLDIPMANVAAVYKSGEKPTMKDWLNSLVIRGRVRLDAFEKFLQELPMSRSRAIMVAHFVLHQESTSNESSKLIEVVDYITDQRLGKAEPTPGVEIYFCLPRSSALDIIIKHLPKTYTDTLNDIDNGLIGIIVWRKSPLPSGISPDSSSSPRRNLNLKSQQFANVNRNVSFNSRPQLSPRPSNDVDVNDDDDDVPPGFGPGAPRDDDDLPEFNFSGSTHPARTSVAGPTRSNKPVDRMRELIQKYGQSEQPTSTSTGIGIPLQPWNDDDDDDDDIPEWQPHALKQPPPPVVPLHRPPPPAQAPVVPPHRPPPPIGLAPLAKPMAPPLQPPMNVGQWRPQGGWWPAGQQMGGGGQLYGGAGAGREWRPNVHRSRGV